MNIISPILKRFESIHKLKTINYLPRWVILFIDMMIVTFSALITYELFRGMGLNSIHTGYLFYTIPGFLLINMMSFWLFRIYSGIIRHSSYDDATKIFLSLLMTMVLLVIFNHTSSLFVGEKLFMNTSLFVNFIFSFCSLLAYRIIVKRTFEIYFAESQSTNLVRALVFGADSNAISVAKALKTEKPSRFRVVGFIDKENQNMSKRIFDLPILNLSKRIPVLMRSLDAEALIMSDKSLTKEEQLAIVDDCLEFNYKVYTVPLISDWDNGKEISKKVKSFEIQDLLDRKPIVIDNRAISNQLSDKTILITGAAGSIGSEIVRQVIAFSPKTIIILDQAETPLHNLRLETNHISGISKFKTIICDVRSRSALTEVFKKYKPEVVFHAAAYKHVPLMEENPAQAIFSNVAGTKNLAELACEYNVETFVMVSTDKAVNPSNVMGASKRIAEKFVQSLHHQNQQAENLCTTKFITTRFGNVLGSNGSVVPLFADQIAKGGPITITHPDIIRYFMTIPEACQLVLEAGAMGQGGEIYIFDMGKPVKIMDLAKKMIRLAGFTPDVEIKIEIVGLRPGEKLFEELLNDNSKTLPTHHEKIMIAQETFDQNNHLFEGVEALLLIAKTYNKNDIVAKMKQIVPEFKSMNSNFEDLDK